MKIKYALLCGLFLFLLSCGKRSSETVEPKKSTTDKNGTTETTETDVNNTPPTVAALTVPAHKAADVVSNTNFSWDASTDADGDDLTYELYLDVNNPPKTKVASDISEQSISLADPLKVNAVYYASSHERR